ncbi:hypothetical protein [Streptomyces syringium]
MQGVQRLLMVADQHCRSARWAVVLAPGLRQGHSLLQPRNALCGTLG